MWWRELLFIAMKRKSGGELDVGRESVEKLNLKCEFCNVGCDSGARGMWVATLAISGTSWARKSGEELDLVRESGGQRSRKSNFCEARQGVPIWRSWPFDSGVRGTWEVTLAMSERIKWGDSAGRKQRKTDEFGVTRTVAVDSACSVCDSCARRTVLAPREHSR